MKTPRFTLAAVLLVLLPAQAVRADIIVDWNARANAAMDAAGPASSGNPILMARTLAIMHLAMFDAIDSCDPTFAHYLTGLPAAPGLSAQAAAHAAARSVLTALYPAQKNGIDKAYADALAGMPDDAARAAAIGLGERVAQRLLAQRKDDGSPGSADNYRPATSPGTYVPTALPVVSNVALRKPFVLRDIAQFRPGPPPPLQSKTWARDFNETREWGGAISPHRSAHQTETARFWEQLGTPSWNQVARKLSDGRAMPLADSARLFALLNIALFDAYLAVFDAKYHYGFWRPITAIRNGDRDGNAATARDPAWRPLIDTPPHPEYPCAHCAADGAAGAILEAAFGAGPLPSFSLTFGAMPGVTRDYGSIRQIEAEVFMARIWGGVHFRNSNEVGDMLGAAVGDYVAKTALRPLSRLPDDR
jgi:hypothetical protein